jgi:hypothetical protein
VLTGFLGKEIVYRLFQDILTAITQKDLTLVYAVLLCEIHREDTLLTLIVDASVEAQLIHIEGVQSLNDLLGGSEIKFVSV